MQTFLPFAALAKLDLLKSQRRHKGQILLKKSACERALGALSLEYRRLVRAIARRAALWRLSGRSAHAVASELAH